MLVVTQEPATNPLSLSSDCTYDGNTFIYLHMWDELWVCWLGKQMTHFFVCTVFLHVNSASKAYIIHVNYNVAN